MWVPWPPHCWVGWRVQDWLPCSTWSSPRHGKLEPLGITLFGLISIHSKKLCFQLVKGMQVVFIAAWRINYPPERVSSGQSRGLLSNGHWKNANIDLSTLFLSLSWVESEFSPPHHSSPWPAARASFSALRNHYPLGQSPFFYTCDFKGTDSVPHGVGFIVTGLWEPTLSDFKVAR